MNKFASRKLAALIAGVVVMYTGLPIELVTDAIYLFMTYIASQAFVDAVKEFKTKVGG